jgi:hypothetical protein
MIAANNMISARYVMYKHIFKAKRLISAGGKREGIKVSS